MRAELQAASDLHQGVAGGRVQEQLNEGALELGHGLALRWDAVPPPVGFSLPQTLSSSA